MNQLVSVLPSSSSLPASVIVPELIALAGPEAANRYFEFFVAHINNAGTRAAYLNAAMQFSRFCSVSNVALNQVTPIVVATYIQQLQLKLSPPATKLHLSALRMLFDYLVLGHVIAINPASSVRGPKHIVTKGKTPVLDRTEARRLLDSIETDSVMGLRDRALIGVMIYSFARVSAALGMNVDDFYPQGRQMWFRLHEKGGKFHEVPAHRQVVEYLDAYLETSGRVYRPNLPIFCTVTPGGNLTESRMSRTDALRMVKRRAVEARLPVTTCCHSFRATGITAYLENGGSLEHAQKIAAHSSARTTKLYDRTGDEVKMSEIERIVI